MIIVVLNSICVPVFAASDIQNSKLHEEDQLCLSSLNEEKIKELGLNELQTIAKLAETNEQAEVVFNELVRRYESGQISATSMIDSYIQVTNSYKSGGSITIAYKVTSKLPNGATIKLGYQYAEPRVIGAYELISATTEVKSYIKTFNGVGSILASRVYAELTARNFRTTKVYNTFYLTTAKSTDYHTVTTAEVVGYWTVYVAAPYVITKIYPGSKIIKVAGEVLSIGGITTQLIGSLDISTGLPAPVVGQHYKTSTWYANNQYHVSNTVWSSETRYENGEIPLYSGTYSVDLPGFNY